MFFSEVIGEKLGTFHGKIGSAFRADINDHNAESVFDSPLSRLVVLSAFAFGEDFNFSSSFEESVLSNFETVLREDFSSFAERQSAFNGGDGLTEQSKRGIILNIFLQGLILSA